MQFFKSNDSIDQRFIFLEMMQIVYEMFYQSFKFIAVAAGGVGGDVTVWGRPECIIWRQGFGRRYIEIGGGELISFERFSQSELIDGVAAADVVENRAAFHFHDSFEIEQTRGGRRGGQNVYYVIDSWKETVDLIDCRHADRLIATNGSTDADQFHFKRRQKLCEPAADRAEADNHRALSAK